MSEHLLVISCQMTEIKQRLQNSAHYVNKQAPEEILPCKGDETKILSDLSLTIIRQVFILIQLFSYQMKTLELEGP